MKTYFKKQKKTRKSKGKIKARIKAKEKFKKKTRKFKSKSKSKSKFKSKSKSKSNTTRFKNYKTTVKKYNYKKALVNEQDLEDINHRKIYTEYDGINRCCHIDNNGKRCENKCVGIKIITSFSNPKIQKYTYIVQCKKHEKICKKKNSIYKNISEQLYTTKTRDVFKKHHLCKNKNKNQKKKIIKKIDDVIWKRIHYPLSCNYGCLIYPNGSEGYKLMKKKDNNHFQEIYHLIKNKIACKKL